MVQWSRGLPKSPCREDGDLGFIPRAGGHQTDTRGPPVMLEYKHASHRAPGQDLVVGGDSDTGPQEGDSRVGT